MKNPQENQAIYGLSSASPNGFQSTLDILGQQAAPTKSEAGAMPVMVLSQFTFMYNFAPHQQQMPFITPCRTIMERWVSIN